MYFMALALDYDGTLAYEGNVRAKTIEALVKSKLLDASSLWLQAVN